MWLICPSCLTFSALIVWICHPIRTWNSSEKNFCLLSRKLRDSDKSDEHGKDRTKKIINQFLVTRPLIPLMWTERTDCWRDWLQIYSSITSLSKNENSPSHHSILIYCYFSVQQKQRILRNDHYDLLLYGKEECGILQTSNNSNAGDDTRMSKTKWVSFLDSTITLNSRAEALMDQRLTECNI